MKMHIFRLGAAILALIAAVGKLPLTAAVYPQAGFEMYLGANRLHLWKPWVALRFSLPNDASLLVKYYHHWLSYGYSVNFEDNVVEKTREASFFNLTGAFFIQKGKTGGYAALSYLSGTDAYKGYALDAGISRKIGQRIEVEGGIYLFRESSVLWYPDDQKRYINLYSLKGGIKISLIPEKLFLHPKIYFYRNSENVKASSYAIGLAFAPKYPFYVTVDYYRYTEAAVYRFAGDYVSLSLNIYY
jgi:hypothetical protein